MSQSRRELILGAVAVAMLPVGALAADEKKSIAAKKAFPFYGLFLDTPPAERSRFTMSYYLKVNGRPATTPVLTLVMPNGARTPLAVGAEGRIVRMPTKAELKDGLIEAAKASPGDRVQLSMELEPLVRLGETVSVADLNAALDQCNTAIKKRAGVIGFAVPKMEQVLFAGAPAGNALLADGKTAPLPQFRGMAFYRPSALPGAQSLKFGKAPSRALMSGKTK
jgi:hypothetical protein